MKKILPFLLLAVLVAGGLFWWHQRAGTDAGELVLYGNVDIRQVALAFDGTGRITDLTAEEGDSVKAGDVIGRLDTQSLKLQAKAQEAAIQAQRQSLAKLRAGFRPEEIDRSRADLAAAEATALLAEQRRERVARLLRSDSSPVSQQDMDTADSETKAARASVDKEAATLSLMLAGARLEEIASSEAELQREEAELELLRYQIDQGELRAPSDAVIRSRLRQPGDMVTPQSPVFALALKDPKWIRVFVRETDLGKIKPGMKAQVLTDSYPGEPVTGTVGYISSVAEFTPKSVQTEELRTSLVYEVHVIVEDESDALRLGQPVTVRIAISVAS